MITATKEPTMTTATLRRPHPLAPLAEPLMDFDITDEIRRLRAEPDWQTGQNAKTLAKHPDFRLVLTALADGHRMAGHRTDGRISIQTLEGRLVVRVGGEAVHVPAGRLLVLDRGIPHDVEAIGSSAFLLTIAWPDAVRH
jgi:quercetin dioxygenase-like cupin family protein